jgi:trehalose synthase-fused probable maltokinase
MTVDALLARHGLEHAAPSMLAYVQRQRWYGSRGRPAASLAVEDAATLQEGDPTVVLLLVRVRYEDGGSERYSLPLGLRRCPAAEFFDPEKVIAEVCAEDGSPSAVVDALGDPRSSAVLWELMPAASTVATDRGELRCRGAGVGPGVDPGSIRPLGREQSNTSLVRGDQELLKWFRVVEEALSPELEMTEALAGAGFGAVPAPLGVVEYRGEGAEPVLLALVQPYLHNGTEGWALALTSLRDLYAEAEEGELGASEEPMRLVEEQGATFLPESARLGEVTADLHLTLASDRVPPSMRAEPVTPSMLAGWAESMTAELDRLLRNPDGALDELRDRRGAVVEHFAALRGLGGGGLAIRVHGDYHLGQTLRTDTGWTVLDFEGEPALGVAERRIRSSALRDVAGMLRSFDYAAAAALAERTEPGADEDVEHLEVLRRQGDAWADANRRLFWGAYLARVGDHPLLPPSTDDTLTLRRAWELRKAVYEVGYELGHRPDWVRMPLRFLLEGGRP